MDFLRDMNDLRLKPRLLRSLVRDILPDEEKRPSPTPSQLSSALHLIKTHGLLSEESLGEPAAGGKLVDAWRSAVEEWVERVLKLASCGLADKCWVGVSLLGITCEECSPDRLVASYSDWFHRLLSNVQKPLSESEFVKLAACASFSSLFTRLSTFSNVKKDVTALAVKLVQPVLNLLTEDAADNILVEVFNLITVLIIYFPSSLHRHYDKIETVLVSKIMSAKYSMGLSKRLAYCLALLPKIRGNQDSWSMMIERTLIAINNNLNDAFQGLEEGQRSSEIIKLLIPPGKDLPPPLGASTKIAVLGDTEKRFREILVPRVSTLLQCCCSMLTNSYPVQVQVPIYPLLKVVERVLMMDGSKHDSVLSFTTSLHQGLICSELPTLHLNALDLLVATIKGLRSQLLPHAANIVGLVSRYFKSAVVPIIRVKLYLVMNEMLLSAGSGMVPYLGDLLINIAFVDLDYNSYGTSGIENKACGTSSSTEYTLKVGNGNSLANTHRKRKHSERNSSQNGFGVVQKAICRSPRAPLLLQITAIEVLRSLLSVGGCLKSESWRSNLDLLLIGVITNAYDANHEESFFLVEEAAVTRRDLQLAAMQLLLASLLSATRIRPRYLSQGLELFRRGKLETGTKLAEFCTHALLSLEVLIHPRVLSLSNIAEETTMDKVGDFNNLQPFYGINNQRPEAAPFSRGFLRETTSKKFEGLNAQSSDETPNLRPEVDHFSSGYINTTDNLTMDVNSGKDLALGNYEEELNLDPIQGGIVSEPTVGSTMAVAENQPASTLVTDVQQTNHMSVDDLNAQPNEQIMTNDQDNDVVMNHTETYEKPSSINCEDAVIPVVNDTTVPPTATHADALSSRIDILRKRLAADAEMGRNADYDSDEPSLNSIPDIVDEEPESD